MNQQIHPQTLPSFWDKYARNFQTSFPELYTSKITRKVIEDFVSNDLKQIFQNKNDKELFKIVDLCSGPGTVAFEIMRQLENDLSIRNQIEITSSDFSKEMIQVLNERVQDINSNSIRNQFKNYVLDLMNLNELPNSEYDVAFVMFGIMFLPDRLKGIKEIFRVLKPGGTVKIVAWLGNFPMNYAFKAMKLNNDHILPNQLMALCYDGNDFLETELKSAGFSEIKIEKTGAEWTGTFDEYWKLISKAIVPYYETKNREIEKKLQSNEINDNTLKIYDIEKKIIELKKISEDLVVKPFQTGVNQEGIPIYTLPSNAIIGVARK